MKINTLFIVLAIICGGIVWGAAGMILFVPFVGFLSLIVKKLEGWQWVSHILSSPD